MARALQGLLGPTWMTLGVDDLIRAPPGGDQPLGNEPSIEIRPDGSVAVGDDFRRAEAAWYQGLAAIGNAGTGLIIDEVFLGGKSSQERLARALDGLAVLWVGVRCDPEVAAQREQHRPDRIVGMALSQAESVHDDVEYDLVVDTTYLSALDCARSIITRVFRCSDAVGPGATNERPGVGPTP